MSKKRILIVDDEPGFTRMLKLTLEETGRYEVKDENQGNKVLSVVQAFRPHLILLDIVMPDWDGATVAAQLKANPLFKDIPIVFLTAIVSKREAAEYGKRLGTTPFVSKPVVMDELLGIIEQLLVKV